MSLFLNGESLSKSYGSKTLFKEVSIHLFQGDKTALIGPNGAGKSTLMKILLGSEHPDQGQVSLKGGTKVAYVPQVTTYPDSTVEDFLLSTLTSKSHNLNDYEAHTEVQIILGKVGFKNPQVKINTLSGGWKKRLDIANALIEKPDLLLLDEPTNHLDLEGILWLENFLKRTHTAFLITSHDRVFLESVTKRVIEINPCYPKGSLTIDGSYSFFLEKKKEFIQGQAQQQLSLSSKVRREVDWLKQTPQARSTKSRSRIQEAHRLIDELSDIKSRNKSSKAQIDFSNTGKKTKKLIAAKNLSKEYKEKTLFSNLDLTINAGDRIAIAGGNGTGKTTLMKLLKKELESDSGTVKHSENLQIVYFDQQREKLPNNITVKEALAPNGETVEFKGKSVHVNSYAKMFLFSTDRLSLPVKQLSGGEKARILIARLMTKSADILFLDEPTNDLDIETLEILEDSLSEFPGAVVFITHDRYLLGNLSNIVIGLGAPGEQYLFADYYQWEEYQKDQKKKDSLNKKNKPKLNNKTEQGKEQEQPTTPIKKLSYKEKIELKNMEGNIQKKEDEIEALQEQLNSPSLISDNAKLQEICNEIKTKQHDLDSLYKRWEELEERK